VPLLAVETPDPGALADASIYDDAPVVMYDPITGARPVTDEGASIVAEFDALGGDLTALPALAARMPRRTIIVIPHARALLEELGAAGCTAFWAARDTLKRAGVMIIFATPYWAPLPCLESTDVVTAPLPLPTRQQLRQMIRELDESLRRAYEEARKNGAEVQRQSPSDDQIAQAVELLRGLPAFAAEQHAAIALRQATNGIDPGW